MNLVGWGRDQLIDILKVPLKYIIKLLLDNYFTYLNVGVVNKEHQRRLSQ